MKRREIEGGRLLHHNSSPLNVRKMVVGSMAILTGLFAHAASELVPLGAQIQVAGGLFGDQHNPVVSMSQTGGFLAWEDNSITPVGTRIRSLRIGNQVDPIGTPFVLSSAYKSKATGDQTHPRIASLPDGSAVVVWQQAGQGKAVASQVFARFLSAAGTPVKSDIRVGSASKSIERDPAVAVLSDGTVVVVWSAFELDGSMDGVFAQMFTSTGVKIGKPFSVNEHTLLNQRQPDVSALSNGGFVVAWISELQSSSTSIDVYARQFTAIGTPVTGEFRVSETTSNACANPSVAGFADGGFAVAWSQRDDALNFSQTVQAPSGGTLSTNGWDIFGRFYLSSQTSGALKVNSNTYGDQFAPKVAASETNCFIVWTSLGQDGSREGVYGQLIDGTGVSQGGEIKLNGSTLGPQFQPSITSTSDGRFIGVWSSLTGSGGFPVSVNFDIFAQVYLQSSGL